MAEPRQRRWSVKLGALPQALVAIAAVVAVIFVDDKDIATGLLVVAGLAVLAMWDFSAEFE